MNYSAELDVGFKGSLGLAVITARCGGLKGDKIRVGGAL
jgi:hypothetical protein